MNGIRDIDLISDLRQQPAETSWFEFKGNNFNPEAVGKRCSALSNGARMEDRDLAYMLWGIEDGTHKVTGTPINPDTQKVGGQEFQLPPPLFRADENSTQVILFGPRTLAEMTPDERTRACYQHAVLKFLSGDRMKTSSLCGRFGIDPKNASQASGVIAKALEANLIKPADPDHPRAGYHPHWA